MQCRIPSDFAEISSEHHETPPGGRSRGKQRALFADLQLWREKSPSEAQPAFDCHTLASSSSKKIQYSRGNTDK